MIDKADCRVPYLASFRPEFRFVANEVRYAGVCSVVRRSAHYQGVVDLRPFGIDAILHAYHRRGQQRNHKLELLQTGRKSLNTLRNTIAAVFDADPDQLEMMRLDFAADVHGIAVPQFHNTLRVKFKRTSDERGELDYEIIGGRKLEYFRYGKAPNCVRVYDKPAECKARFPEILRSVRPGVELPTFENTFGFPEDAVITRIERQAGSKGIPDQLIKFGQLHRAAEFDPFTSIEILPDSAPIPDANRYGVAAMLKLRGTGALIEQFGYQTARAMLNRSGNGKRFMDAYNEFLKTRVEATGITADSVRDLYRASVQRQIGGSIEKTAAVPDVASANNTVDMCYPPKHNATHEITGAHPRIFPEARQDRRGQTPGDPYA